MYNMNPTTYVYVHIKHFVFYNLHIIYYISSSELTFLFELL